MSETVQEKIRGKIPWVVPGIRLPKISFPDLTNKNLDLPTPSTNILLVAIYVFLFYLLMGGVYLGIPDSSGRYQIALGANSNGDPIWLYPSVNDAFIIESFVAAAIIFIGAFGFIALYQSTKHVYNTSYAQKLIAMGVFLAAFSFLILQYIMINGKGG
jgi:hypothetical protein